MKIALEKEKLALQRAQLEVNAIGQASQIADAMHTKEVEHISRVKAVSSEDVSTGQEPLGGDLERNGI